MLTRFSFEHMSTSLPRRPDPVRMLLASRASFGLRPSLAGSTLALTFSRPLRRSFIFQPVSSLDRLFSDRQRLRPLPLPAVTSPAALEQQLPGGIPSSHWGNAPFPWRTKDSGQKLCSRAGILGQYTPPRKITVRYVKAFTGLVFLRSDVANTRQGGRATSPQEKSITMEHTGPRNRNTFVHHVESACSCPRIACTRQ